MRPSILLSLFPILVNGHMQLISPFALNQQDNPNAGSGKIDYNYASPLAGSGADYPCKGHLSALGGAAGAPVATWKAGSTQSFKIGGGAAHMGGSCQASLSEDKGKNFRVMKSYIGGCPVPDKAFTFTVPKEALSGQAVFAWTWFNNQGNREMYMNCASVAITDGGSGMAGSYPYIFRANIGNGCATEAGADVVFPNPGGDVENVSTKAAPPIGNCGSAGPELVKAAAMSTAKEIGVNTLADGPAGDGKAPKTILPTKAAMEATPPSKAAMEAIPPSKAAMEANPPSKAAMEASPPSKAAQAKPIAPSGTAVTTVTSPVATGSAYLPVDSVGTSTPSPAPSPEKECSCICNGYSFQFSPDEL